MKVKKLVGLSAVAVLLVIISYVGAKASNGSNVPTNFFKSDFDKVTGHRHKQVLISEHFQKQAEKWDTTPWQVIGPEDLINILLKESKNEGGYSNVVCYSHHYRWIKDSDIPYLMNQITNTQRCGVVMRALSSEAPPEFSTVSDEVCHLIVGYWKGYYPVEADSSKIKASVSEIQTWYNIWKQQF